MDNCCIFARTLLGAPGIATRNKKLLVGLLALLLGARTLLEAPVMYQALRIRPPILHLAALLSMAH